MGCGQSKILIYHRKSKAEKNSKNNWVGDDSEPSDSHPDESAAAATEGGQGRANQPETERQQEGGDGDTTTPLLQQSDISTSQIDFFKMLDEKIESGPDYEEDESEREAERHRLQRLMQDWMPMRRPPDTQRFPTAYQPCPPNRPPPRICPRPPLYPSARAYAYSRAVSVESTETHFYETYNPIYGGADPRLRNDQPYPPPTDPYGNPPMEPQYSRMVAPPLTFASAAETQDFYNRRVMLSKANPRAMSFDAKPYARAVDMQEQYGIESPGPSEYMHRGPREQHYNAYGVYMAGPDSAMHYSSGQEQVQYIQRPPPREIPPLQGAPGPPHGSPRPLTVRLPTSTMWRRPRGPVTELA